MVKSGVVSAMFMLENTMPGKKRNEMKCPVCGYHLSVEFEMMTVQGACDGAYAKLIVRLGCHGDQTGTTHETRYRGCGFIDRTSAQTIDDATIKYIEKLALSHRHNNLKDKGEWKRSERRRTRRVTIHYDLRKATIRNG